MTEERKALEAARNAADTTASAIRDSYEGGLDPVEVAVERDAHLCRAYHQFMLEGRVVLSREDAAAIERTLTHAWKHWKPYDEQYKVLDRLREQLGNS